MLIRIVRWLIKPEVWRFVCSVSSVVGLFCYALSSSFSQLFGKWIWWKILLYIIFSFIICLTVLFAKSWQDSTVLQYKAHLAFLVLTITSVYSFFLGQVKKGKPDVYSLISSSAFAIMSLGLSTQTHCGIELDLLYFFCGNLIAQLMTIKLLLGTVGVVFSYSLIILRSYLNRSPEIGYLEPQVQDQVVIQLQVDSDSEEISSYTASAIHLDFVHANIDVHPILPQKANFGCDLDVVPKNWDLRFRGPEPCVVTQADSPSQQGNSYRTTLMTCIEELKKENQNINKMISRQIWGPDLLENRIWLLEQDKNLVSDALPSETISKLHRIVVLMVESGFEEECCNAYSSWRREFLVECLSTFGLQEFDMVEEVESWIKASDLALMILFPNEKRLCDRIFQGLSSAADISFMEVCRELTIRLLRFPITLATASHSPNLLPDFIPKMYNTLSDLIWEFESLFSDIRRESLKNSLAEDARTIQMRLSIFGEWDDHIYRNNDEVIVPSGGLHPVTKEVMSYLAGIFSTRDTNLTGQSFREVADLEGNSLLSRQIACIMEKLEKNLETKSINTVLSQKRKSINTDLALCCLFVMNNLRYMEEAAKQYGLVTVLGDGWLEKIAAKVQQYLGCYQSSSWNKLLDFLKLDNSESEEAMKEKINLFNQHFTEICYLQSEWFVFDKQLREQIIISIENILLLPYGIFIGRFKDVVGECACKYIEHGILDIQNKLRNYLFYGSEGMNPTLEEKEWAEPTKWVGLAGPTQINPQNGRARVVKIEAQIFPGLFSPIR